MRNILKSSLDTAAVTGYEVSTEPQNSFFTDGCQPVSLGFFCVFKKRKNTAIRGREWASTIPAREIRPPFCDGSELPAFSFGQCKGNQKFTEVPYV